MQRDWKGSGQSFGGAAPLVGWWRNLGLSQGKLDVKLTRAGISGFRHTGIDLGIDLATGGLDGFVVQIWFGWVLWRSDGSV